MSKNLLEVLRKEKILSSGSKIRSFLKGKKLKIVANISNHTWPIGEVVELHRSSTVNAGTNGSISYIDGYNSCYVKFSELEIYAISTKEDIRAEIKDVEKEIKDKRAEVAELKDKIKWMEEVGAEEFDENEFKAYHTLSIVESAKTKAEKAKAIAALLNG